MEKEGFEERVFGFSSILEGAGAVAAGEGGRRHESAVKDVALVDLRVVEEDGERGGVEESDDLRVMSNEGTRRHVGSDDGGVVLLDPGGEEFVAALFVEVVVAVV
ncbi:uncharacterized protein DS421_3g64180 [Arachis hypogaea]|nr:uncharacterized protein DS421_3g64180 [Arachis hypogaea]